MNTLEDKLRVALEETAEEIAPYSVPPLRLRPPRRRWRPLAITGGGTAWLAPLAAAISVAVVILASVAIAGRFGGSQGPGPGAGSAAGLPQVYVALRFSPHSTCCTGNQPLTPRTLAVVVNTATGAVLATLAPPEGDTFAGVTGAADDRTFVLAVQKYGTLAPTRFYVLRMGPAIITRGPTTITPTATSSPTATGPVLSTISPTATLAALAALAAESATFSASGAGLATPSASPAPTATATATPTASATLTPTASPIATGSPSPLGSPIPSVTPGGSGWSLTLSPLSIPPATGDMLSFALSPQGTSLAILDDAGLHVVSLATGAQRTWDNPPGCFGGGLMGTANSGVMLSWAADGRHLAIPCNGGSSRLRMVAVLLLDTEARGGNLLNDSQRLVTGPMYGPSAQPPWDQVLLTHDGRTVVGVLEVPRGRRPIELSPMQELVQYSAHTGTLVRVLNHMPVWNDADFEQVLWASPTGHSLLVSDTVPYPGHRRASFLLNNPGVLTGGHLTPLRHWYLDTMAAAW
jgi:hypothetical protein